MIGSSLGRKTTLTLFLALVLATPVTGYVLDEFRVLKNATSATLLCVSVGEPLYPGTTIVPLDEFRSDWMHSPWNYQISVNYLTMQVKVQSPDGNVGAFHVEPRGLIIPLVDC